MSNSPLISGTLLTNNCTKPRNHKIDRITPHYMAWYTDAKTCCESFLPSSRKASANYCIGKDGEIWLNVEEKNRAWTTGSSYNDNRAITIECANYMESARYGVLPSVVWDSLVLLCIDICQRNDIKSINYTGNDYGNLTKHKWYQDTDCPGPWLSEQFDRLAYEINSVLGADISPTDNFSGLYTCNVDTLNVRTAPSIKHSEIVAQYHKGETVYLDNWYTVNDGFVWGRYTGFTSGVKRYIAVGKATGKPEPDDYLIKVL